MRHMPSILLNSLLIPVIHHALHFASLKHKVLGWVRPLNTHWGLWKNGYGIHREQGFILTFRGHCMPLMMALAMCHWQKPSTQQAAEG